MATQGTEEDHPKGYAIAITKDNLKGNLWTELSKWRRRHRIIDSQFDINADKYFLKSEPSTWKFEARSFQQDADEDQQGKALAGLHENYTLVVLDESGGMPDAVMASAEGSMSTGKWNKIVQAGNPTHIDGPLYNAVVRDRHLWTVLTVTGDPDDPKRSRRMKLDWCREQIQIYGRDSNFVKVNVFNEFPSLGSNALFGPEQVEHMMSTVARLEDYQWSQRRIGVDVARFGDDSTVIFPRQGLQAFMPVQMRESSTTQVAARVAYEAERFKAESVFVDVSGPGAGVVDSLLAAGRVSVIPVDFGGKADESRFANKRVEQWWRMAEWAKRGGSLPRVDQLSRELPKVLYKYNDRGQYLLEKKADIKERLGYSPDFSDALSCTFAFEEMPGDSEEMRLLDRAQRVAEGRYEPFPQAGGPRVAESEYDVLA